MKPETETLILVIGSLFGFFLTFSRNNLGTVMFSLIKILAFLSMKNPKNKQSMSRFKTIKKERIAFKNSII
jgi:hypothetical protein